MYPHIIATKSRTAHPGSSPSSSPREADKSEIRNELSREPPLLKAQEYSSDENPPVDGGRIAPEDITPFPSVMRNPEPSPDYMWKESEVDEDARDKQLLRSDNAQRTEEEEAEGETKRDLSWESPSKFLKKTHGAPEGFTFYLRVSVTRPVIFRRFVSFFLSK